MKQIKSKNVTVLDKKTALVMGICGILGPIGIQDFATHLYWRGAFQLLSKVIIFPALQLFLIDIWCGTAPSCDKKPQFSTIVGAILLSISFASLVVNLIECIQLISNHLISLSIKKFLAIIFMVSVIALFAILYPLM